MSERETIFRQPHAEDRGEWLRMRRALWPETSQEGHAEEIDAFLTGNLTGWLSGLHAVAVFVAARPAGGLCGFLEASVRPIVDGCLTQPVGYIEGWFVDPDVRRQGVGKRLARAAEEWALGQGCREMASDAHLANAVSIAAHKAVGFEDDLPTVRFRKGLPAASGGKEQKSDPSHKLSLALLEGSYAVCRLAPDAPLPPWVGVGPLVSVTRTAEELSLVCKSEVVPKDVRCERGWRCLRVSGMLDFSLVGVLASLLDPLAKAGVCVFVLSTFDTDYLLVQQADLQRAADVLQRSGHTVCG